MKLTWVGYLNMFVLQWFFIRLAYHVEIDDPEQLKFDFFIIKWVVPMTGWWGEYIWVLKKEKVFK